MLKLTHIFIVTDVKKRVKFNNVHFEKCPISKKTSLF